MSANNYQVFDACTARTMKTQLGESGELSSGKHNDFHLMFSFSLITFAPKTNL